MSNRKYLRLADGYHERSPYNPYQSSGNKYSSKQSSSVSDSHSGRTSSNINGGSNSRNNSPRATRHSNLSPRSHRLKSTYSKTKELCKRGSSSSPVEVVSHHGTSSSDRVLKIDGVNADDNYPWSQHTSSSGKTYFYNCKTEKSQWEKPKDWVDRSKDREKKKREKIEHHSRDTVYANHIAMPSKDKPRESSSKRDSHGNLEGKSDLLSRHGEDSRRHHHSSSSQVIKTTSANTFAVSTTSHRPEHLSARPEQSTVSPPCNSLQDVSPPVTPSTVALQNSPLVGSSPVVTTRSPILLGRQKSPIIQTQSPASQPHLPPVPPPPLHGNSTTPPPPPPPYPAYSPHTTQNLHGAAMSVQNKDGSYQSSPQMNQVIPSSMSSNLPDNTSFNGIHVLSQSHQLHPLQQATLLQQAQFQSGTNIRPITSGIMSASPPLFQPIKQTNSTPSSPLSFTARPHPTNSLVQTTVVPTPKPAAASYVAPQSINTQDFAVHFDRKLVSHTVGWSSEMVERQSQKLSDESFNSWSMNNRLKADLIPLNFHHNLTAMRMGVGAKRIEFLREQRKKLEASDWIS